MMAKHDAKRDAKRDAYIASIKAQLDELNFGMTDMEERITASKEVMRSHYAKEMEKLHIQAQHLSEKLDEIKSASESSWESMITTTEQLRDAFVNSCHYFKAQLRDE
ncbi:hypothetical protein UNDKW_0775 [Undibacterium sp. KW1]|uniref:hypothetical protein n=1 Tax=Undibacterium sp. KW1 TaxID=2058624 RepID=UPI001331D8F4|nr:hypothetical protein [Undibacterium sp. KW1]BBB59048.1 hypothetical protein UNDKW_0775 [Undibacterium sp. KW1]